MICYRESYIRVMAPNLEGALLGPGRSHRARSLHLVYTPTRARAASITQVLYQAPTKGCFHIRLHSEEGKTSWREGCPQPS